MTSSDPATSHFVLIGFFRWVPVWPNSGVTISLGTHFVAFEHEKWSRCGQVHRCSRTQELRESFDAIMRSNAAVPGEFDIAIQGTKTLHLLPAGWKGGIGTWRPFCFRKREVR